MNIFKNKHGEVRSGWDALWVFIAVYGSIFLSIAIFIFAYIFVATAMNRGEITYPTEQSQLIFQSFGEIIASAILLIIWKKYHKQKIQNIGLVKENAAKNLVAGLLTGIVSIGFVFLLMLLTNQLKIENVDLSVIVSKEFILGLFIFIIVGFYEELLSRGYFMNIFKRTRNKYVVMILPALLFSLLHLANPNVSIIGLINIVLVGLLFAVMFIGTGSLWFPIGYHITWNFFQGNIFGLNVSGMETKSIITNQIIGNDLLTGASFGAEGGLYVTGLIIAQIVIFIMVLPKITGKKFDEFFETIM